MNRIKETAEHRGIPTFVVADAGRTQVQAGSKTVLAVGPGWFLTQNVTFVSLSCKLSQICAFEV
jgi:peptidyl-tRNA hydrolase